MRIYLVMESYRKIYIGIEYADDLKILVGDTKV